MSPDQLKPKNYFLCNNNLNSTDCISHEFHYVDNMGMAPCHGLVDGWSCPVLGE